MNNKNANKIKYCKKKFEITEIKNTITRLTSQAENTSNDKNVSMLYRYGVCYLSSW